MKARQSERAGYRMPTQAAGPLVLRAHQVEAVDAVVRGRAMLAAPIDGRRDPRVLADLAERRMRRKNPELVQTLTGCFREHRGRPVRLYLDQHDRPSGANVPPSARS